MLIMNPVGQEALIIDGEDITITRDVTETASSQILIQHIIVTAVHTQHHSFVETSKVHIY